MTIHSGQADKSKETLPILVVDDDIATLQGLQMVLILEGYQVAIARDGREALQEVMRNQYGLIILDSDMPVMTGSEFIKAYDKAPGSHAPVIICSGRTREIKDVLPPFVKAEILKPIEISELIALVQQQYIIA